MANIFNANWVVYYNPGQYVSMQEKFFEQKKDAQKFMKDFAKQNPNGQVSCFGWDKSSQAANEDRRIWADDDRGLGEYI